MADKAGTKSTSTPTLHRAVNVYKPLPKGWEGPRSGLVTGVNADGTIDVSVSMRKSDQARGYAPVHQEEGLATYEHGDIPSNATGAAFAEWPQPGNGAVRQSDDGAVKRLSERLDGIDSSVSSLNSTVSGMSGTVSTLQSNVSSLQSSVGSLDRRVTELSSTPATAPAPAASDAPETSGGGGKAGKSGKGS